MQEQRCDCGGKPMMVKRAEGSIKDLSKKDKELGKGSVEAGTKNVMMSFEGGSV